MALEGRAICSGSCIVEGQPKQASGEDVGPFILEAAPAAGLGALSYEGLYTPVDM